MYTPAEISTIKDLFEKLVSEKRINIELDAFGDPVQQYSKEAMDRLVDAISSLENFPAGQVIENALLEAAEHCTYGIFVQYRNRLYTESVQADVFRVVNRHIAEAAFLEISESLFTQSQIKDMLRKHPDYLDMVQRDIREGKLLQDELDDSKQRCADMNAAPKAAA